MYPVCLNNSNVNSGLAGARPLILIAFLNFTVFDPNFKCQVTPVLHVHSNQQPNRSVPLPLDRYDNRYGVLLTPKTPPCDLYDINAVIVLNELEKLPFL